MKKLGFHILTAVLVVLVLGGSAELVVRVFFDDGLQYDLEMWKYARYGKRLSENPEIGHEHVPGANFRAMGVDIALNEHGMRDPPRRQAKGAGDFRIMMLGDSLTFGWGVEAEETFSRRLERRLREKNPRIEILNTGVGNTNTPMQAAYFAAKGRHFAPDLVILNTFINDAEPNPRYGNSSIAGRNSYAWTFFAARIDALLRLFSTRMDWKDYYLSLYGPSGNWPEMRAAILRIVDICRSEGCAVLIVVHPEIRELDPYPFAEITARVREVARAAEVPFLDLLPSIADQDPATLWVTVPDPHPNGRANAFFADSIFSKLVDEGMVPADPAQ